MGLNIVADCRASAATAGEQAISIRAAAAAPSVTVVHRGSGCFERFRVSWSESDCLTLNIVIEDRTDR